MTIWILNMELGSSYAILSKSAFCIEHKPKFHQNIPENVEAIPDTNG